jgi:hypothetical protein
MKRAIKKIVDRETWDPLFPAATRHRVRYIILECNHSQDMYKGAALGDVLECDECDRDMRTLQEMKMMREEGTLAYVTLKDLSAGQIGDPSWMSFKAYFKDPKSPTGVNGCIGVSFNKFMEHLLTVTGLWRGHRGPQRGSGRW